MGRYQKGMSGNAFQKRSSTLVGAEEDGIDYGFGIDPEWPRIYRHVLMVARDRVKSPTATSLVSVNSTLINMWLNDYGVPGPTEGTTPFSYLSSLLHVFLDACPDELWSTIELVEERKRRDGIDIAPPDWVMSALNLKRQVESIDQANPDDRVPQSILSSSLAINTAFAKDFDAFRSETSGTWVNFAANLGKYGSWLVKGAKKAADDVLNTVAAPAREIFDVLKKVILIGGVMIAGVFSISLLNRNGGQKSLPPAEPAPRTKTKKEQQADTVAQRIKEKS